MTGAGLPKVTVCFAWDTGASTGDTYESEAEARADTPTTGQPRRLLRLYVDENGRIVHTVEMSS